MLGPHALETPRTEKSPLDRAFALFTDIRAGEGTTAVLMLVIAWRERDVRLWIVLIWLLGVLTPFTLATSKTPSATLLAWPAGFLVLGAMISRALPTRRGKRSATPDAFSAPDASRDKSIRGGAALAAAWVIAILLSVFFTGSIQTKGMGYSSPSAWREHFWAVWQIALALAVAAGAAAVFHRLDRTVLRKIQFALATLALYGGTALGLEDARQRELLPLFRRGGADEAFQGYDAQLDRLEAEPGVRQQL